MRFEFLGPVAIVVDDQRFDAHGEQPALALARLVLERPAPLWRGELADLLWPIQPPQQWEGPARQVVSRARALLVQAGAPNECITSKRGRTELLLATDIVVDVEDGLRATANAEEALARGETGRAAEEAAVARELLQRPFFPASEAAWTARWQDRIRGHLTRALHAGADALIARGQPANAVPLAREALELDAFDEAATRALMAAFDAMGSRGNALAAYEKCRRLLDEELGVRPSDETEAAYLALLGGAPLGAAPPRPTTRALVAADALPFVGRLEERARLDGDWNAVQHGATRAVVIEGEPGIGKTRLAAEVARDAQDANALVLWGACQADVGLPHQPFGDLLAQLLSARPAILDVLGPLGHDLAALVPDLVARAPAEVDDYARARLFRAVTAAFDAVADEPLVVVIDDLQWAGDDAVALLRHLIPGLAGRPCLLVVTVREASGPVAAALADVHRMLPATALHLEGLSVAELAEVIDASGLALRADLHTVATEVRARTTGNPFYVSQLVGAAVSSHTEEFDPAVLPDAIAQLVQRRLDALDGDRATTLSLAAVAGTEFELATLEACSRLDHDELLEMVEDLSRRRFLEERAPGQFGFAHALVRDAVLATLSVTRLQRTHLRIADALAARHADAALLAYHYAAAGAGAAREATHWSLVAGDEALRRAAWSDARDQFARAAELSADADERCAAGVGLGRAQQALGDAAAGRSTIEDALAIARSHGRSRAAAHATLALVGGGGRGVAHDLADADRTALLREALAALDDADTDLLVPALGELALSLVLTEAKEERDALTERCVREARRTGQPDAIATALWARRIALMGPSGTIERAADAQEILGLPSGDIAPERRIAAHLALVEDLLELGDRAGAQRALAEADDLAARLAHPYWSWATTSWRALDAIIDGDLDTAEALAFGAFAFQAPAEHPEAVAALGVNLIAIRLFGGRAAEMLDVLRDAVADNPNIPAYRAVLALCSAETGDLDTTREALGWFAARDYALPPDSNWLLGVAVLADASVTAGDQAAAVTLADLLAPYADREVVLNCFGGGGSYWGPVTYHLGRSAALAGRATDARTYLEDAVQRAEQFGAARFVERSRAALEAVLRA
jgi:DNA-binding SARP family transcriptional activator